MTAHTLMLLAFFYLFYGPLVSRLAGHPVVGTLLHMIGHAVVSLALGALAYRLTLRALERRPAWGRWIWHVTSYTGVFAFLGFAGGPQLLRSSPELCVKVRGSSSMLLLGCLGDLLRFEKREIQVATFAPDRSSP